MMFTGLPFGFCVGVYWLHANRLFIYFKVIRFRSRSFSQNLKD